MTGNLPAPQGHCLYGPSSLARLDLCPASARLFQLVPEGETSEAAERGTRIHALAAALITGRETPKDADAEELKFAEKIAEFAAPLVKGREHYVERRLAYNTIEGELYWGTSDLVVVYWGGVMIYDWKTGFSEIPEAEVNLQGAAYALAAMQEFGKDAADVCFYNPCTGWKSLAHFDSADALAREVCGVIERAKDPNAPCNPSEDACRYCNAKAICPAHLAVAEASCNLVEMHTSRELATWEDAAVALWYNRLQMAAKFLESELKPELLRRIADNGECGGLRVKQQSGGREARDVCQVAGAVHDVLSNLEILECCNLSIAKLKAKYAEQAKYKWDIKTKKEGETMFENAVAGLLSDKEPRRVVYKAKEAEA